MSKPRGKPRKSTVGPKAAESSEKNGASSDRLEAATAQLSKQSEDPKVFKNVISLLKDNIPEEQSEQLQEILEYVSVQDTLIGLMGGCHCRAQLQEMISQLPVYVQPKARAALADDGSDIINLLREVLNSDKEKTRVLQFEDDFVDQFIALLKEHMQKSRGGLDIARDGEAFIQRLESIHDLPDSLGLDNVNFRHTGNMVQGSFAAVFHHDYNGQEIAVKRMSSFTTHQDRLAFQEKICRAGVKWQQLEHPHILSFIGIDAEQYPRWMCLVSPWMKNGTILEFLKKARRRNIQQLLLEVAEGMEYLHSQDIIHRDLKGSNVLIDDENHAHVADFGLVGMLGGITHMSNALNSGSNRWKAPEIINPASFGFRSSESSQATDVYAFACVCLEVYTGQFPFFDIPTDLAVADCVRSGIRPKRPNAMSTAAIPDDIWDIIQPCWKQQPSERPSFEDVVAELNDMGSST